MAGPPRGTVSHTCTLVVCAALGCREQTCLIKANEPNRPTPSHHRIRAAFCCANLTNQVHTCEDHSPLANLGLKKLSSDLSVMATVPRCSDMQLAVFSSIPAFQTPAALIPLPASHSIESAAGTAYI
ncbi:hypothetical protein IF1G_01292 [Cordyceps javanica]|uniref:Uncharacterized protein n=1 Tax=Cordyceps javanica TaxID=43265 RepID=A0A545VBG9_9HYPO|nr:hypothetical protein IF1G_01292 [Cordyceps javanica]